MFQTTNPTYAFALDVVRDEYPNIEKYRKLLKYYESVAELEGIEYQNADRIIANSELIRDNIMKYHGIEKDKIEVIPNGVSPEECNFERTFKNRGGMKIILFPGTIHTMKGFHYLLEAMVKVKKEVPEAILFVCGRIHGYEYDIFKKLVNRMQREKLGILMGVLPREKLFKYYHIADVCCIPLIFGNMSISILESVAHGLPIVTTSHSGFPEINKVGIKIPSKNPEATADAIITLLSDPELIRKKSENAKGVIKNYYWDKIAKQFLSVYKKM